MAVLKLRFKDDQGQEFPSWEEKRLGDICLVITKGASPKLYSTLANDINFIKVESVENNQIIVAKCPKIPLSIHNGILLRSRLSENDVLFSIVGTLGIVAKVDKSILPANTNQNFAIIRLINPNNVGFIFSYLQNVQTKKYVYQKAMIGAQLSLNLKHISDMTIFLPSLQEQRKIADFLSSYDALIDYQSQRVETLQKRKLGLLQRVFSRELRFKDDQGNEFPDWEEKRLGDVASIKTGTKPTSPIKDTATFEYINAGTTNSGYTDNFNQEGNVITTPSRGQGGIGHVGYQSRKFWLGPLCYGIMSCKKEVLTPYLYCFLLRFNQLILDLKKVGSIPAVNRKDLLEISVQLPSLEEQRKIADFLGAVDAQIEVERNRLESMKTIKKGLLQQMFI